VTSKRVAVHDTTIDQYPIPAGTTLVLPIWCYNKSSKLWGANAQDFSPERWIDFEEGKPPKSNNHGGAASNYNLVTFLHGPRSCIGQGFSKAELRSLIAAWIYAFEFEMLNPGEDVVPYGLVTVKPRDGLWLKIRSIGSW
jgi:cytochrome P450